MIILEVLRELGVRDLAIIILVRSSKNVQEQGTAII
jgi:hypothetical protein